MRFFLSLILALMFPIPAMANKHQAAPIPTNPATSQELNSLNAQRKEQQSKGSALSGKQDFWHHWAIGLGVVAALIGLLAGAAAYMESIRSYALRAVDSGLSEIDGKIADWRKRDADWRIQEADLKRVALANRILDIFGPRQLTAEQSARIVARLADLKGVKIDVYVYGVDNPYVISDFEDSRKIGVEVLRILKRAHMNATGWILKDCHGSWATGLVIATTGDDAEDTRIGSQVIKALQGETGTDPNVEKFLFPPNWCTTASDLDESAPNKRQHDAKISIIVGRKFTPILTREMLEPEDEQKKP